MKPLIRVKSSFDELTAIAKGLFDVYDAEATPNTTIAKGEIQISADSAEQGELAAINAALGSLGGKTFIEVEIQSDLKNIRDFLKDESNPATHADVRSAIATAIAGKTITTNPLPAGSSETFTKVAARV